MAVTGAGLLCPVAGDVAEFATALYEGHSGVRVRSPEDDEISGGSVRRTPGLAAPLRDFSLADAVDRLGVSELLRTRARRLAARAPLPIRAAVVAALQAWQDAGLAEETGTGEDTALVVGGQNLASRYTEECRPRYLNDPAHLPARYALHMMDTDHVGVLSALLGITAEGYTLGGASASGNLALVHGARLVDSGTVRRCLVVGAMADLSEMELQGLFNLGAMAGTEGNDRPELRCRPFDRQREGFVPGQGVGCLVLERADRARTRAPAVYGLLAGHAVGLDGNQLSDPDENGETRVMIRAIRQAGVEPSAVDCVNTHGTASRLGDETEARAIENVLGSDVTRPWINATKGWTGHCLGASGVIEAIAVLLQMRGGFVHPNANLTDPLHEKLRFVGGTAEPARLDYVLSNSFGFGGMNSSLLLAGPEHALRSG
ncbi:polyketide biosynthesis malonyl-ACP decarboxylase PksF [Actinopolyspora lacussalsi]